MLDRRVVILASIPAQLAAGHLLGYGLLAGEARPDAVSLLLIAAGNAVGVAAAGLLVERLLTGHATGALLRLLATAGGCLGGAALFALAPPLGYSGLLLPLGFGIVAFHLTRFPFRRIAQ